jgi:hypothetical protein
MRIKYRSLDVTPLVEYMNRHDLASISFTVTEKVHPTTKWSIISKEWDNFSKWIQENIIANIDNTSGQKNILKQLQEIGEILHEGYTPTDDYLKKFLQLKKGIIWVGNQNARINQYNLLIDEYLNRDEK